MERNHLIAHYNVDIVSILGNYFAAKGYSQDGFFVRRIDGSNCRTTIFIAEEYYLRINSTLTLTVIVEESAYGKSVDIISSGGKSGLLGLSYGAEQSAVKHIINLLKANGFTEKY